METIIRNIVILIIASKIFKEIRKTSVKISYNKNLRDKI